MVVSETHIEKEPSTMDITTLGIDLAKSVFQLHGVDAQGVIVLQKKLRRGAVVKFLSKLEPCLIGIEACATSHYWAREIAALGHDVKMIPPAYVIHMSNAKRMMPQMRKPSARPSRAQTCASCQ
jgi:transposase